jgi:putative tricarboxylic transport membrane protein
MYGGSTTSILLNIPGEAASVVTCIEGHEMAKKGRGGAALGISAIGSFFGGTVTIILILLLATPLSNFALKFGPPEYFIIMVLGMFLVVYLSQKSILKGLIMAGFGIGLGFIGMDLFTSTIRFGFGVDTLSGGIPFVPMLMGLFGISEVLISIEKTKEHVVYGKKQVFKDLFPNLQEWIYSIKGILRGTIIGFMLGVLPGGGTIIASFAAYSLEKKYSKRSQMFGTGVIEGVAAPETANNAATTGAFIPLFILGIPTNVIMALLISSLIIHGLQPGPTLIQEHPDLFWGTISSMYIGNTMCLIFNFPLIGVWVKLLSVPYRLLFPLIVLFCAIGAYSVNNQIFDIFLMIIFGILGYLFRKTEFDLAPMVLAFVLGPMLETALRQSLTMSKIGFGIFVNRPIPLFMIAIMALLIIMSAVPKIKKMREKAIQ